MINLLCMADCSFSGFFKDIFDSECCSEWLQDDFRRGILAAVAAVAALLLFWIIFKIIWALIFRVKLCKAITMLQSSGELSISAEAIADAARSELQAFPEFTVTRMRLYRKGKKHILILRGEVAAGTRCADIADRIRPQLLGKFNDLFSITSITDIRITIDSISHPEDESGSDDSNYSRPFGYTGL